MPMGADEPGETPVRGAARWSPAVWGACLSLVTCFPALLLFARAAGSDGSGARLALFGLYPTFLTCFLCPETLTLGLMFGQFLLYGIALSLPTRAQHRRRARFILLGVHLALVAACFLFVGLRK